MYSGEKLTDLEVDDILKHIDLAEDLEGNVKYEGTLELQEPCRSRKRFQIYISLSFSLTTLFLSSSLGSYL